MVRACIICKNKNTPLFQFPRNPTLRYQWFAILEDVYGIDTSRMYASTILRSVS